MTDTPADVEQLESEVCDCEECSCEYEDCEELHEEIVRAKWTIDGAKTLAEAAKMAHNFGDYLQGLHDEGYIFTHPVEDDYGFFAKPGEKCEMCGYVTAAHE